MLCNAHKGIYEDSKLPYKPATAIFQRDIELVFKDCPYTANLLGDLIVTGRHDTEHLGNLREVFKLCLEAGFLLNKDKCQFLKFKLSIWGM